MDMDNSMWSQWGVGGWKWKRIWGAHGSEKTIKNKIIFVSSLVEFFIVPKKMKFLSPFNFFYFYWIMIRKDIL